MAFLSVLVPDVVLFYSYSSEDGTSRQETGSMAADNRMAVQARFPFSIGYLGTITSKKFV
jgi:hypothetical protein